MRPRAVEINRLRPRSTPHRQAVARWMQLDGQLHRAMDGLLRGARARAGARSDGVTAMPLQRRRPCAFSARRCRGCSPCGCNGGPQATAAWFASPAAQELGRARPVRCSGRLIDSGRGACPWVRADTSLVSTVDTAATRRACLLCAVYAVRVATRMPRAHGARRGHGQPRGAVCLARRAALSCPGRVPRSRLRGQRTRPRARKGAEGHGRGLSGAARSPSPGPRLQAQRAWRRRNLAGMRACAARFLRKRPGQPSAATPPRLAVSPPRHPFPPHPTLTPPPAPHMQCPRLRPHPYTVCSPCLRT
jgi:hypothetical protein